jgi:hypothetical protein
VSDLLLRRVTDDRAEADRRRAKIARSVARGQKAVADNSSRATVEQGKPSPGRRGKAASQSGRGA